MGWNNLPQEDMIDSIDGSIPESPPVYKEPDTKTVLVDLATEVENKKTYTPEEKLFEKRKEEGFSMAPPVDIYEPGFRSDLYEAILAHWKHKRETREKHAVLKEKMGWRS